MGNQPTPHNFIKEQWQLIEKTITHAVWRNRAQPTIHIEEHDKFSTDEYTYLNDKHIFQFRHNSPYLVAGVCLQEHEEHEFCSTNHKYRVFIEKIPIRLTDIEHIPFPDILHLYHQCLLGFELLAQRLGYFFEVEESYIGINERGVVKVWLSKYLANSSSIGGKISQQQMVKGIIDIVDKNSDPYQAGQTIPTVRNYIYRNADALQFAEAKRELYSYIDTYHKGIIPSRLDCVEQAGGVYAIANRPEVQQSAVGQHYQYELTPPYARMHDDPNRPQLISNTNISQQQFTSHQSHQNLDYMPLAPLAAIPNELNLKGSEALPHPHRQKVIVNPVQVRQNMEVVRRRRSEHEKEQMQSLSHPPQNNMMKYSQTIHHEMPLQSRHLNLSRNIPITQPIQSNIQFNFVPPNQTIPTVPVPPAIKIEGNVPRRNPSQNFNELSQQITFKQLNQSSQPISANQSLQFSANPSINNFSPAPSLINSHRAQNSSNIYIPDQTRTISEKSVPFASPEGSVNQSRKEVLNSLQNNSFAVVELKGNTNQKINYASTSQPLFVQQNKKQVSFTPSASEQKTSLLASFNPAYTNHAFVGQPQRSIEKQVVPERIVQNGFAVKKSTQINPDDGKSSEEFMRKLREINSSFNTTQNQKYKYTLPVQNTPTTYNGYSNGYNKNILQKQGNVRSFEQIGTKTPVETILQAEEQQFGRNAVSNIIENSQHSYKNINPFGNNQPLKFEQGLTMKYSRLEADEPQLTQFTKPSFGGKYETKIDSDLLADLNRFKK